MEPSRHHHGEGMLDYYFISKTRLRQLRQGPLADHMDRLAAMLRDERYSKHRAARILSLAGQFSRFAKLAGIGVGQIDRTVTARFLEEEMIGEGLYQDGLAAMNHVLRSLNRERSLRRPPPAKTPKAFESIIEGYELYMRDARGLRPSTSKAAVRKARSFLAWLHERFGDRALCAVGGADVIDYVSSHLHAKSSRSERGHLCSSVRGILRYLHFCGATESDLTRAVPSIVSPRLGTLPERLRWDEVRTLIDSVDTNDPVGMRDKAILLLLATLGMRGCEVRELELGDIAWRAGEIRLRRTKTRRERVLPLSQEIGIALADYVLHGRPPLPVPQVFLRHSAPPAPVSTANTIVWIVRRRLRQAGIKVLRGGAHMLRHSLASHMVNTGVPIKSIADVLGHVSIDTTAIYTKVDTQTLATVALPFPGGQQ